MVKREVLLTCIAFFLLGLGVGFNAGIHIDVPVFLRNVFLFGGLICCFIVGAMVKNRRNKQDKEHSDE
jgi:ethanolamine transporter EutH